MIRNQMKNEKNKNKLKMKMKMKIENLERETYGDLVERDLRLEVDVISGSRERAFHCYYSLIPKHAPYHTTSSIWWITEILSLNFSFNFQSFLFSFLYIYFVCPCCPFQILQYDPEGLRNRETTWLGPNNVNRNGQSRKRFPHLLVSVIYHAHHYLMRQSP